MLTAEASTGGEKKTVRNILFIMFWIISLAGCASQGVYLPPGTLFLGEASHVLTQDQIASGKLGPQTDVNNLRDRILEWGFTNEQISNGRVVVVREGIYWNNVVSGVKRDMLRPALMPDGMNVEAGNILEGIGSDGKRPYTICRIRAKNLEEGQCYYSELPTGVIKGIMGTISLVGPSGAATLYCRDIEKEGWIRPRTYWHRLPQD